MTDWPYLLDLIGVAVFAASGALVASRRELDLIGFALFACLTGLGGGTLRDAILDRPVFWIGDEAHLAVCLAIALAVYLAAPAIQRRYPVLLWLDALGIAAYGVLGAHIARQAGADALPAIGLGLMTATFGGMIRDVIAAETPLILKRELYATCAVAAAALYVALTALGVAAPLAAAGGAALGFGLRAGSIVAGWSLPRYRPRPGRSY